MKATVAHIRRTSLLLSLLGLSMALAACGGGGGGGGTGTTSGASSSPMVSSGAMTKGSVILNNKHLTAAAGAIIRIDDNNAHVEAELRDGMEVKVKGQINDDRINGQFEKVEVQPGVRGAMGSKGADDFTVHAQHVITDDKTVFEDRVNATTFNSLTFALLANTDKVEVHGGRDDLGNIHATRVERRNDNPLDDVKGVITALTPGVSLSIGSFTISIGGVPVSPAGATLSVGNLVEVHLNAAGTVATQIDREDLEHQVEGLEPAEGQEFEAEGFVSGFTAHPGTFKVGNDNVQTTSTTKFEGGVAGDLMNGIKVEAEGHKTGGVLVAEKIEFRDSVRIEANAASNALANVLGKTVKTTSGTQFSSNLPTGVAGILATDGLRIRGFPNADDTSITATRVEKLGSSVNANQIILQGPVRSFSSGSSTLDIAGITVNVSGAGEIRAFDETPISATTFFNSLTANRTIVKARGSFAGSTLTADKAEIEKP